MKLIAQASEDRFIAEVSRSEIYNICGYNSKYSDGAPSIQVGSTVRAAELFSQLGKMAQHERELTTTARTLELIAENLKLIAPIINEATKDVPQSSQQ